jgi:hypothetical protein
MHHVISYKPFRIVTLASSGSEGGADIGAMRLAQTAGYGVLPAPAGTGMENTFLAQAFDTGEKRGRFCAIVTRKTEHLPTQARDNRREKLKKDPPFSLQTTLGVRSKAPASPRRVTVAGPAVITAGGLQGVASTTRRPAEGGRSCVHRHAPRRRRKLLWAEFVR